MKVFVVYVIDHDFFELTGVFDSRKKAEEVKNSLKEKITHSYLEVVIEERIINDIEDDWV